MRIAKVVVVVGISCLLAGPLAAQEIVEFTDGSELPVRSHRVEREMIRVWLDEDAQIAFPRARVSGIKHIDGQAIVLGGINERNRIVAVRPRTRAAVTSATTSPRKAMITVDRAEERTPSSAPGASPGVQPLAVAAGLHAALVPAPIDAPLQPMVAPSGDPLLENPPSRTALAMARAKRQEDGEPSSDSNGTVASIPKAARKIRAAPIVRRKSLSEDQ